MTSANTLHQLLGETFNRTQQAYDAVWRVFMRAYMGVEVDLSPVYLRELYPWYEQAEAVERMFGEVLTQTRTGLTDAPLEPEAVEFLTLVASAAPTNATKIMEKIKPGASFYRMGDILTVEQSRTLHMVRGSFTILRGAGKRLNLRSFAPDDAKALENPNLLTLFGLIGAFLRQRQV